ncbi:MAG: MFS transporter, partial [Candidatus Daviesbacteria bacterium]|nr:MFS transporter [Candidatus Daviesbacteria bacterium]
NSIFSATLYSCFLLGFGLAGPLISHLGINFLFGLGGVLLGGAFLLSLVFPSIITKPDQQGKKLILALRKRKMGQIKEIGLNENLHTMKLIKGKLSVSTSIMILAGVQMVIGILAVLVPGFLERSLQIEATNATYVLVIPLGLGIVIGGLVLGKIGNRLIKRQVVSGAVIFSGLLFFLVGIVPVSKVLMLGSFLMGVALVSILVPSQTVLQENTPDRDRGKVFSVLGVVMAGLSLVPVLLVGVLADIFGTTPIFIGLGAAIMLVGLFGLRPSLFFSKDKLPFHMRQFLGLGHWKKD